MVTEVDTLSVRVTADTTPFQAALRDLGGQADRFSGAISRAFRDAVIRGKDFESVLRTLALRIADIALDAALKPIGNGIAGIIGRLLGGIVPFGAGGFFDGNGVQRFASGGVVNAPMLFPLGRSLGLAGEAGAEAILPLARGSDGRLGVRSGGEAPLSITVNIATPDAESFRKGEAQVTALLARAVRRGRRGS